MNSSDLKNESPIVVFGTGGSGTRVVAEILKEAGCFIGYNLNNPLDNQDFGFMLSGRIDWMVNHFPFHDDIALPYLDLFKKVYFYQSLNLNELVLLYNVTIEYIKGRSRGSFRRRPLTERLIRGRRLLKAIVPGTSLNLTPYQKWGFKSPEAIYFIFPLIKYFRHVKLIHLIRDGRDMIFSKNRSRLQYLEMFKNTYKDPFKSQLSHWGSVNRWAFDHGRTMLPEDQYLLIRYEDLCEFPLETVDRILFFTGLGDAAHDDVYQIPQPNPTINRWEKHKEALQDIDESDLRKFGYVE